MVVFIDNKQKKKTVFDAQKVPSNNSCNGFSISVRKFRCIHMKFQKSTLGFKHIFQYYIALKFLYTFDSII
jgi:hypothetical protein